MGGTIGRGRAGEENKCGVDLCSRTEFLNKASCFVCRCHLYSCDCNVCWYYGIGKGLRMRNAHCRMQNAECGFLRLKPLIYLTFEQKITPDHSKNVMKLKNCSFLTIVSSRF